MAHYALLDENNIVIQVIVGKNENEDGIDWEQFYSNELGITCLRTSYNTLAGRHAFGGDPFRKNYAGIGYTYNKQLDAFIPPRPYTSWILNQDTCQWAAPTQYPVDGKIYKWNEDVLNWVEIILPTGVPEDA